MTQITRLYDTSRQISALETELKNASFKYAVVTSAQPSQSGATLDDTILAALGRAGITRGEGRTYVDAIKKGGEHNNGAISGEPDKIIKMTVEEG